MPNIYGLGRSDFERLSNINNIPRKIDEFASVNNDLQKISHCFGGGCDLNDTFAARTYGDKNIPYLYQRNGITMLHYFAYHGLPDFLNETIKRYKNAEKDVKWYTRKNVNYNISQTDTWGKTALHYACNSLRHRETNGSETRYVGNQVDAIKILLAEGLDINQKDCIDNTPFDTLINSFPTYDLVKMFMKMGISVTEDHKYIIANKLARMKSSEIPFDKTNDATILYKLFLPPKDKRALLSNSQWKEAQNEARDKVRYRAIMHEENIYHKFNDLLAVRYLLDNPYMSAKNKMILDKISTYNMEHIIDFDYAKRQFGMQKKELLIQPGDCFIFNLEPQLESISEEDETVLSDITIDPQPVVERLFDRRIGADQDQSVIESDSRIDPAEAQKPIRPVMQKELLVQDARPAKPIMLESIPEEDETVLSGTTIDPQPVVERSPNSKIELAQTGQFTDPIVQKKESPVQEDRTAEPPIKPARVESIQKDRLVFDFIGLSDSKVIGSPDITIDSQPVIERSPNSKVEFAKAWQPTDPIIQMDKVADSSIMQRRHSILTSHCTQDLATSFLHQEALAATRAHKNASSTTFNRE